MELLEELRQVKRLAEVMETKLIANQHKEGWENEPVTWLLQRGEGELDELTEAIEELVVNGPSPELADAVWREAADVANFVMMAAYVATNYDNDGGLSA